MSRESHKSNFVTSLIGFLVMLSINSLASALPVSPLTHSKRATDLSTCPLIKEGGWPEGPVQCVYFSQPYAFVGAGRAVIILDCSDASHPMKVSEVVLDWPVMDIEVKDNSAYVALGRYGMMIIDTTEPTAPHIVSSFYWPYTMSLSCMDTKVILGCSHSVAVVDVSVKTSPMVLSTVGIQGEAYDVVNDGQYAYIAGGYGGLSIVDVRTPTAIQVVGYLDDSEYAYGIDLSGNYALMAGGASGMLVYDVSDKTTPVRVATLDPGGYMYDVKVYSGIAVVANAGWGFLLVNVEDPTRPSPIAPINASFGSKVQFGGAKGFLVDTWAGLRLFDFSNPTSPTQLSLYGSSGPSYDLKKYGDYVLLSNWTDGLKILKKQGNDYVTLSKVSTNGWCFDVEVKDHYAFAEVDGQSVLIIDLQNIESPQVIGQLPVSAYQIKLSGNHLYIASYDALVVYDVSQPELPTLLGQIQLPSLYPNSLEVEEGVAVVACANKVFVYDVSNPAQPVLASTLQPGLGYCAVGLVQKYLFAQPSIDSVDVYDLTNPYSASKVGTVTNLNLGNPFWKAVHEGIYLYLAAGLGVTVLDVTDPKNPQDVAYALTPDNSMDVLVNGGEILVSCLMAGIVSYDTSHCLCTVDAQPQVADIGFPGQDISFAANASTMCSEGIAYSWEFGDETTSSEMNPTHAYSQTGEYTWRLSVSVPQSSQERSGTIRILEDLQVQSITKKGAPFRVLVTGTNFLQGISVYIDGVQWTNIKLTSSTKLTIKGGSALKAAIPKGTQHQLKFVNPDGGQVIQQWGW